MSTLLARIGDLAAVDTVSLKSELANALKLTASHLSYLAAIWAELEKRGEDLSGLKMGMGVWLARIAAGTLLAEIVVMYAGEPSVLRRASLLTTGQQQHVVESGQLPWVKELKKPKSYRPPKADDEEDGDELLGPAPERLLGIAKHGSVRDVALLILEMLKASDDPKGLADEVVQGMGDLGYINVVD
jgi:hypothetical protein